MTELPDRPLRFHPAFKDLVDQISGLLTSTMWLKASAAQAEIHFRDFKYIAELNSSMSAETIKLDKSIIRAMQDEPALGGSPLSTAAIINIYRVSTIAVQDIVWDDPVFTPHLQRAEVQFLRHLRNASAHMNRFWWGAGRQHDDTVARLPVAWRGKSIEVNDEGRPVYFDFMAPGDLFFLLSDISALVI
jgi:hypothetical protein